VYWFYRNKIDAYTSTMSIAITSSKQPSYRSTCYPAHPVKNWEEFTGAKFYCLQCPYWRQK